MMTNYVKYGPETRRITSSHTPAPWVFVPNDSHPSGGEFHGPDGSLILLDAANVALVCAAPLLAEALEGLLQHLGPYGYIPEAGEPATRAAQAALRAAMRPEAPAEPTP